MAENGERQRSGTEGVEAGAHKDPARVRWAEVDLAEFAGNALNIPPNSIIRLVTMSLEEHRSLQEAAGLVVGANQEQREENDRLSREAAAYSTVATNLIDGISLALGRLVEDGSIDDKYAYVDLRGQPVEMPFDLGALRQAIQLATADLGRISEGDLDVEVLDNEPN